MSVVLEKQESEGIRTDSADDTPEAEAGEGVLHEIGLPSANKGRALPEIPVVVGGSGNPGARNWC